MCIMELKSLTPMEATEAVRELRDLVMSFEEPGAREQESLQSPFTVRRKETRQAKLLE